ncbi:MAG: leucine-rich repeat protein [Paludibacteraceae bacterium]|nr:leucine-rich repeat protein [Paludibacteraceae bacterium]
MKTKISLMMLLLAAWLMVGCEGQNEPTSEGGDATVESTDIASVNKKINYYGTVYEVIMKDGNRMYFGIKNDKEVRMGCWSYFYDGCEDEYETYAPYEYKGHLVIPEKITLEGKEYLVTELYDMAEVFLSSKSSALSGSDVNENYHRSEYYVTHPNTTLQSVVIPNTIKKITSGCFAGCTALQSVKFEKGSPVTELPERAFLCCSSLEEVILPENLAVLDGFIDGPFICCTSLKSINLPETVTEIGDQAFLGCTSLENINLENVKTIGDNAFMECTALKKLNMNNVDTINASAFYKCTSLETVTLDNLEFLGREAFDSCTSLISVVANELEFLDEYAFVDCANLRKIEFVELRKGIISGTFHKCTSLEEVKLDNLEVLGKNAFNSCTSLKKIELPSIKYLGIDVEEDEDEIWWSSGDAFVDCRSMETVVLGESLIKTNKGKLFERCDNLKDVYCYAVNPPLSVGNDYDDLDYRKFVGDFILHVPAGSIEAYKETKWGEIYQLPEYSDWEYKYAGERTIVAVEQ